MNFTHLFAFYEVARAGSLSGGARRLRVSQPAVSREVKELEGRLGVDCDQYTGGHKRPR
ncbi:LysR family transcriptional regulator [Paraburkholderia youngii]|uniref:LysR family transcriptional regulator n=1 Tax=Paraburkholderia youngii TaxID=2782701 RepID=UPI003D2569A7